MSGTHNAAQWWDERATELKRLFKESDINIVDSQDQGRDATTTTFLADLKPGRVCIIVCRNFIGVNVVKQWADAALRCLVVMRDDSCYTQEALRWIRDNKVPWKGREGQPDYYDAAGVPRGIPLKAVISSAPKISARRARAEDDGPFYDDE